MTSERATAYGGVIATIEELGAVKLQPAEIGARAERPRRGTRGSGRPG